MRTAEDLAVGDQVIEQHRHHTHTPFYIVWGLLLVLTAVEVALAYQHLPAIRMLSYLLALSVIKAGMIIGWFMHMKYEVTRMRRVMMISLVICLSLMCTFFPDAFRILHLGVR